MQLQMLAEQKSTEPDVVNIEVSGGGFK
jgi:hypothetical protein